MFYRQAAANAPVVVLIGSADTCFEDFFLTVGRNFIDHGYAVALVDLPGQGFTPANGLHWEAEAERPITAVIDQLVARFGAELGRIALLGLSLGGSIAARAAGHETRLATVLASTPFPNPARMFALSVQAALASAAQATVDRHAPQPPGHAVEGRRAHAAGDARAQRNYGGGPGPGDGTVPVHRRRRRLAGIRGAGA